MRTEAIKIAWSFVRRNMGASFAVLGGLILVVIRARRSDVLHGTVKAEIGAQAAANEVHAIATNVGLDAAHEKVRRDYEAKVQQLSHAENMQALELNRDPAKLAAFLVKAGAK